jgi:DNA-binding response OmpR family regulator
MAIRVLLADPERLLVEVYAQFLTREGFEVMPAVNEADLFENLHDRPPDVVVLEPELAGSDGEKLIHKVAAEQVPVIILARKDYSAKIQESWEHHIKPFPMSTLAKSIRNVAARIANHHTVA